MSVYNSSPFLLVHPGRDEHHQKLTHGLPWLGIKELQERPGSKQNEWQGPTLKVAL